MAKTASTMRPLGSPAPDFLLPDTYGKLVSKKDFVKAPGLLVMFICNHCPYVVLIREELARACKEFQSRGLGVVAINSNDAKTYPADAPEKMKEEVKTAGYSFPYLYDESQEIARAFDAACTPDFFLFDKNDRLVYRGQFDGARPGASTPVTGNDLREAVYALLDGNSISEKQIPSLGCNIKWKL